MDIKASDVANLRKMTGAPMMDCKKALEESGGDSEKAIECLRKKGAATAAKRADREAKEGIIATYVHGDKIGVLVEVNSETDFVARSDDFKAFARDAAMHIAAANPEYLNPEDVPKEVLDKEKEIETEKLKKEGKPENILEKIWEGKKEKFYAENCLLKQNFVKNPDITIEELLSELIGKIGEKIEIRRFCRFELGK
ncbi:translation elongation factor Ts [candidate division WS5 bacterium]|uniref:Elongation factor Ts n=1 Tax=candidate division WS5 bacterium TaxID=2093353 RepID=A0A419DE88_9BACT|nr:MAG: translation elongation factor Ts [candidate division WS5 bacterium]